MIAALLGAIGPQTTIVGSFSPIDFHTFVPYFRFHTCVVFPFLQKTGIAVSELTDGTNFDKSWMEVRTQDSRKILLNVSPIFSTKFFPCRKWKFHTYADLHCTLQISAELNFEI